MHSEGKHRGLQRAVVRSGPSDAAGVLRVKRGHVQQDVIIATSNNLGGQTNWIQPGNRDLTHQKRIGNLLAFDRIKKLAIILAQPRAQHSMLTCLICPTALIWGLHCFYPSLPLLLFCWKAEGE